MAYCTEMCKRWDSSAIYYESIRLLDFSSTVE